MPYSSRDTVEFYGIGEVADGGQYGSGETYLNRLNRAIEAADGMIDDHCKKPRGFFNAGGVQVSLEYHNGNEVANTFTVGRTLGWSVDLDAYVPLYLNIVPVLSVVTVEEETSAGTWTTRTEGSANDYLVREYGIHYVSNFPNPGQKNIRVTYLAGYELTPETVRQASAKLAVALLQEIRDNSDRRTVATGGVSSSTPVSEVHKQRQATILESLREFVNKPIGGGFI